MKAMAAPSVVFMTMIRKLVTVWTTTLVVSLLLPLATPAVVTSTTHDLLATTTTASPTVTKHATTTETVRQSIFSNQAQALSGLSRLLLAPKTGASSSMQRFRLRQQLAAEEVAGARAPTSIRSYSEHALEQVAGRDGGIGVRGAAIEDAFSNPAAIQYVPSKYGPTFRYVGNNATVVVNTEGRAVTGWATTSAGVGR